MQTVPFSDKIVVNYFDADDKETIVVDYENSTLKGKEFITYLSNVDILSNVYVNPELSYEEREELILAWLDCKNLITLESLSVALLHILFQIKDIEVEYLDPIIRADECQKFKDRNNDLVLRIALFFEAVLYHCLVQYKFIERKDQLVIDNPTCIPKNIINLFMLDDFFLFYSKPSIVSAPRNVWFTHQFEDENSLIKYFYLNKNLLTAFLSCIDNGTVTVNGFFEFINAKIQRDS